jgi:hypothetical protein
MKTQTAVLLGIGGVVLYLMMKNRAVAAPVATGAGVAPALTYCAGAGSSASTGLCNALNTLNVSPFCAGGCSNAGGGNISYCL